MKWYLYMLCWMIYAYHVVIFQRNCFMTLLCILFQMYLSVHKLLQQYTKNYIDSIQNEISAYLNIDTKIIHVIIYDISISSSYCHWNLLWTAITCTTISTLMKFCSYKWHKDLQQFSTEKWIDMSYEIYLPYSDIHYHLLLL